jgi:signal transduction histidine kinase
VQQPDTIERPGKPGNPGKPGKRRYGTDRPYSMWTSIPTRIVGLSIGLVFVTVALLGILAYASATRSLFDAAESRLTLVGSGAATLLENELRERFQIIQSWAALDVMQEINSADRRGHLATFLTRSIDPRRPERGAICMDAKGRIIAQAGLDGLASIARPREVPQVLPRNFESMALVEFGVPVMAGPESALRIGSLSVFVEPHALLVEIASVYERNPWLGFRLDAVADSESRNPTPDPTQIEFRRNVRIPDIAAGWHFVLTITEPVERTLTPVKTLRRRIIVGALAVMLLASIAGSALALRISRPIRNLTLTVQNVARTHDKELLLELPKTSGEVGVLAAEFGSMIRALAEAEEQSVAQSRLALLGEVAASVGHEVRTPLSALRTAAQLLGDESIGETQRQRLAEVIVSEVDRLNTVVTDLTDSAKPRTARKRPVKVSDVIERTVGFFHTADPTGRGRLTSHVGKTEMTVVGDPDQLHQVLLNLVRNATQAGGRDTQVRIHAEQDNGMACIVVEDNGPGFTIEDPARPFATSKPDGVGLGLSIAKRIVEDHDGTLELANAPGGGALVAIVLPLEPDT